MKTITSLDPQFGVNPQLVVKIIWSAGELDYALDEMDSIYGYIKEFSNLSLVSHTEGFGQVNSIEIVAFDAYGHFKDKFESEEIFNVVAAISIRTVDDATEVELFNGIIEDPTWDQEGKEFSFSVVSKAIKGKLGYTPHIDDIHFDEDKLEYYRTFLSEETWPNVFGYVEKLKAPRLTNISKNAKTTEDLEVGETGSPLTDFTNNIELNGDFTAEYGEDTVTVYFYTKNFILKADGKFEGTHFNVESLTHNLWLETPIVIEYASIVGKPAVLASDPGIPLINMQLIIELTFDFGSFDHIVTVIEQNGLELYFSMESNLYLSGIFEGAELKSIQLINQFLENFTIPKDTSLYVKDRTNYDIYIVDSKKDTTVQKVQIEREDDKYETLIEDTGSGGDYTVENTSEYDDFWDPSGDAHPHCTYIKMSDETFFKYFSNFVSDTKVKEAILVDCTAVGYTKEREVITYLAGLIGLTAEYHGVTDETISWATLDEEDLPEIISEIAWQGIKGLRRSGTTLDVFDLQSDLPIVDVLNLNQIQFNKFKVFPSDYSELITKLTLSYNLIDLTAEPEEQIHRNNEDLYDTLKEEADVYIFNSVLNIINTGNYWITRYSDPEYMIELTGSLDLMKYEVWDKITITTPTHRFAKESPLAHIHTVSDAHWGLTPVIVKEVSVNFNDMSVTLLLRSNKIVGTL